MGKGLEADFSDKFMDYDKLSSGSGWVCDACLFCISEKSERLASMVGKDKPQRMRNYSHFVLGGEWIPLSKSDKRRMLGILLSVPEVAVISNSGQKHLIARSQAGRWQFEEQKMVPDTVALGELVGLVEDLYDVGFSKREILSGDYSVRRIMNVDVDWWRELDGRCNVVRGAVMFELAVFLAQKGGNDGGIGSLREPGVGVVEGHGRRLQEEIREGDMESVSDETGGRSHGDKQFPEAGQLALFQAGFFDGDKRPRTGDAGVEGRDGS